MHPKERLRDAFSPKAQQRQRIIRETRERLLKELHGGLWHTTIPERYENILSSGFILPEPPNMPDNERWSTSQGKEFYPYVRQLGGVSLFDFDDFDPEAYSKE
jgi:hypothetical protein